MTSVLPKVTRLSNNVIRILGLNPGPFTLQGSNTYLIGNGPRRVLLDTGEANRLDYADLLDTVISEQRCKISSIILTHWHEDHCGGLPGLVNRFNLGPENLVVYKKRDVDQDIQQKVPYTYVEDGFEIKTEDGLTLRLYETPGHTKDHLATLLVEERALFSGDCILGEGSAVFEDFYTYMQSLHRIKQLNLLRIYPGHGPVVDQPMQKVEEYIEHRLQRENQILQALPDQQDKAVTVRFLLKQIYPQLESPKLIMGALGNINKHLIKLIKEEKVGVVYDETAMLIQKQFLGQKKENQVISNDSKDEGPRYWKNNH